MSPRPTLAELTLTFLKVGALSFGGPYAILAYLEREIVTRRAWVSADEYARAVGIGHLTPGPIAYSATVYLGYRLRGFAGAVLASIGLIAPSFVLAVALAIGYQRVSALPSLRPALEGLGAAVLGLLLAIAWKMAKPLYRVPAGAALALAAFVALVMGVNPAIVIILSGVAGVALGDLLKPAAAD